MADVPRKVIRLGGPWKGINENPIEATEQQCEEAWNLDFDGEYAKTRGGRKSLGNLTYAAVSRVIWEDVPVEGSSEFKVITGLDQGVSSANTQFDMAVWAAADYMYVGFPFKFASFVVYVRVKEEAARPVMSAQYYNGSGWQTLTITDGTAGGSPNHSLGATGAGLVSFTIPTDWKPVEVKGGDPLYWVKLKWDVAPIGAHLGYINCNILYNGSSQSVHGIYHWQRNNGERLLVIGADDQVNFQARLFEYNRVLNGTMRPFTIRGVDGNTSSGADSEWRFAALGNILIACNGYCLLHSTAEDPRVMVPFERVEVREAADLKPFVPTDARYVAVHAGRIYYVSKKQPNVVFFSQPVDGPIKNEIVGSSPLGGAGIFDAEFSFQALDSCGGPITGIVPQKDKLLVFTPRSTQAWYIGGENVLASGLQTLDNEVGCVAPGSLSSTNSGVFFLGAGSVYVNVNGNNEDIGARVSNTIAGLNTMSLVGSRSCVYLKKHQYRLYLAGGINNQNDTALVFNWKANTWAKYGLPSWISPATAPYPVPYYVSAAASLRDEEWDEEIVEADYGGRLLLADTGRNDYCSYGAVPIYWQLTSHRSKFLDGNIARVRGIRCFSDSYGNNYFNIGIIRDGRKAYERDGTSSAIEIGEVVNPVYNHDDPAYGADESKCYVIGSFTTGLALGTGTWTSKRMRPTDATFGIECFYFQLCVNSANRAQTQYDTVKLGSIEAEVVLQPGRR